MRQAIARTTAQGSGTSVRWLVLLLGLAILLVRGSTAQATTFSQTLQCDWSGQDYDDFYTPPDLGLLVPERLGELLRVEHIRSFTADEVAAAADLDSSPYGAQAYRVLFLSQAPVGTPQAVSGLIVVPIGPVPEAGFPVLAHGHGTTGMADECAPSRYTLSVYALLRWVAYGYLVTASDYVGLGTPGLHPYGIGEVAGFSMLDSARAGLRFCDSSRNIVAPAANQIILEGHSQGGHSALFAHQLWETYAPELNLLGTVTFAPGAELRFLAQHMAEETWSLRLAPLSLAMYAYSQYYGTPHSLSAWLKEPYASQLPDRAESQCVVQISAWLGMRPEEVIHPSLLAALREGSWQELQPWTGYIDANTPGNHASQLPIIILQGELDLLIPPEASERLTQRLCEWGTPVKLDRYAGTGHSNIVKRGLPDAVQWVGDRLAGAPVPSSCPAGTPGTDVYLPIVVK